MYHAMNFPFCSVIPMMPEFVVCDGEGGAGVTGCLFLILPERPTNPDVKVVPFGDEAISV
jgi:hypothetical protein